jgi:hypothetical protein
MIAAIAVRLPFPGRFRVLTVNGDGEHSARAVLD